jgi:hypothetical protein
VTISTLDSLADRTSTHQPSHGFVHIALADDHDNPVTGYALCGYRVSGRRATPVGDGWLCVVCEHLANGDRTEP